MIRRQPRLMTIMDRQVRRLQVAGEARGVEQRAGEPIVVNFGTDLSQPIRVQSDFDRELLVLLLRGGDQLRYAYCREQACGDAAGKRFTSQSEYRQAGPQSIARSRARVVRQGVQK